MIIVVLQKFPRSKFQHRQVSATASTRMFASIKSLWLELVDSTDFNSTTIFQYWNLNKAYLKVEATVELCHSPLLWTTLEYIKSEKKFEINKKSYKKNFYTLFIRHRRRRSWFKLINLVRLRYNSFQTSCEYDYKKFYVVYT
jgi:hypothetical protein